MKVKDAVRMLLAHNQELELVADDRDPCFAHPVVGVTAVKRDDGYAVLYLNHDVTIETAPDEEDDEEDWGVFEDDRDPLDTL